MAEKQAISGVGPAYKFFGKGADGTLAGFKSEWDQLTERDKAQVSGGIADGTLTY